LVVVGVAGGKVEAELDASALLLISFADTRQAEAYEDDPKKSRIPILSMEWNVVIKSEMRCDVEYGE
jgi:hypothetical protein